MTMQGQSGRRLASDKFFKVLKLWGLNKNEVL